ncbi:MAG: ribosomal RNA assembly protein krr1 [Paramarteilia canceri]
MSDELKEDFPIHQREFIEKLSRKVVERNKKDSHSTIEDIKNEIKLKTSDVEKFESYTSEMLFRISSIKEKIKTSNEKNSELEKNIMEKEENYFILKEKSEDVDFETQVQRTMIENINFFNSKLISFNIFETSFSFDFSKAVAMVNGYRIVKSKMANGRHLCLPRAISGQWICFQSTNDGTNTQRYKITYNSNTNENWTMALKYALEDLKYISELAQEIYDENTSSALVYIKRYVKDKKVFINRRNRMFGPDGMTLKAIQMITETTLIIQGGTVAIIGPERGVKNAVKIVEDVMKNVHPVFSIKELMDKKKLQKNPQDAITTINDAVSNSRKKANKESRDRKREIKKAMKAKALKVKEKLEQRENDDDDLPELPKKSKIDLQIESGEYFMNEKDKKTNYLKKKKDRQRKKISEKKEEIIEEDSIPDISNQPKKKTKKHNKIPSVKNLKEKLADFKQ